MRYFRELISVIVPVYNIAQYIEKCVRSICDQTYKELEILLVVLPVYHKQHLADVW